LSSSPSPVIEPAAAPKRKQRIGRRRKLTKRTVPKPDGRYLILYEPK